MNKIYTAAIAVLFILQSCVSVEEVSVARYRDGKKAAISFTFDDGLKEHLTLVAPHLEANGFRGTFWICGAFIEEGNDPSTLTWAEAKELSDRGHEVSNHAWSHKNLPQVSEEELAFEVRHNDDAIAEHVGIRPVTFCYPFNAYDDKVLAYCMEGRVGTRTFCTAQGQVNHHATPEAMEAWLDRIISEGEWGVTMTHGIHTGYDQWNNEQELWDFYDKAGARKDELWGGLFKEVSAYIAERDACTLSVERQGRKLIVTPQCGLDSSLYSEPLTLEITLSNGKKVYQDFDPYGGPFTVQ